LRVCAGLTLSGWVEMPTKIKPSGPVPARASTPRSRSSLNFVEDQKPDFAAADGTAVTLSAKLSTTSVTEPDGAPIFAKKKKLVLSISVPGLVSDKVIKRAVRIIFPAEDVECMEKERLEWDSVSAGDKVSLSFSLPSWLDFAAGKAPPGPEVDSEIVARAVNIISPKPSQQAACRDHVAVTIGWDRVLHEKYSKWVWTKETSKKVKAAIQQIGRMRKAIIVLPKSVRVHDRTIIRPLLELLAHEQITLEGALDRHRSAARTGRRDDMVKANVAQHAYDLLDGYGSKKPNLTPEAPFYQLASLLYEAATGKIDIDLQRACRGIFAHCRQRGRWATNQTER
jgi:hypothetical protein